MVSVSTGNIDQLKGMPDVEFDFGVSSELKTAFRAEATRISGQRGSRAAWRTTGSSDFKGHFSQVFIQNGTQQLADLDEVVTALRLVATKVEGLEQAAREENERRKTARDWAQRQADRSGFDKWVDEHITGGEDPPAVHLSDSGPSASAPAPARGTRQNPPPGSGGGGGGGTSSARPANLTSFATSTSAGDSELAGTPPRLVGQCSSFDVFCGWATLDASGPIQGVRDWVTLNGQDATWATTVANAFTQAGGTGPVSTLSDATIAAALQAANVPASRRDIEIDPPTAYGSPPTTGYSNDPINTATGNFTETECDLAFGGSAVALQLSRTYNSLNSGTGAYGRGWNSWTEIDLSFDAEAGRLRLPDGRAIVFPRLGTAWDRGVGENLWLASTLVDGELVGFEVTGSTGLRWRFGVDLRLQETSSGAGTAVRFRYDDAGRLVRMTHEHGRAIELVWNGEISDRIAAARSSDGREVAYRYDEHGRLTTVQSRGGDRHYRWNDADLIEAVTDADGVIEAENAYDEHGRVTEQRSPFGRLTRFVYLAGGITEVSDAHDVTGGERSNTWLCDGKGRLIGVVDADGHRQSTSYDRHGNPVMVTQRDGSAVLNFYDDRGRKIREITPTGADLEWTHDDADRVVEVRATADEVVAVTRLRYVGDERNPAEVTDPEGGVTTMAWAGGLMARITDPEGVSVGFDYDAYGDLVATTDADGNVARLERDDLGRITAAITPLGHRTSYRYDGVGPLVTRQDPNGGIWRYEHTAAGRLRTVIDPTGGRTDVEHGSHGETARTIDPLGRATSTAYDDLGNRTRVELPDGSAWGFEHDAMSRLVATTDPAGEQWRMGHDATGSLTETLDPTGVRRTVQRDAAGRPTQTADTGSTASATYDALGRTLSRTSSDGSTNHYRYDRCGRLVQATDADGAVTRVERDRAGRPVHVTHPSGLRFHYDYDRCGRRAATIDTDSSRYGFGYDADGRLVREFWPTGDQAWIRYDDAGQIVERHEPGRGTSRFGYDPAGRLVRSSDGWNGQRRFGYDAAGQLTEAIDALGGLTRFDYDDLGRCVVVTDPLGGRTERQFDLTGRLTATTDPLGRITRYGYDAAGRQTRLVEPSGATRSWDYDDAGRMVRSYADGELLSEVEWHEGGRTMVVREGETTHQLVFDARGRLIRRLRGAMGISWTYDADGQRTSFTGPNGEQTRYAYDAAGRVSAVETPRLGRAVLERDAIGRVVSVAAPGLHASWTWQAGSIARLEVRREGSVQVTEFERDESGRVLAEIVDGVRTGYDYDAAGQLVATRVGDGPTRTYAYDGGGRLVGEGHDGHVTRFVYDAAGQLLAQRNAVGRTEFSYDGSGRRIREVSPDGERRYAWDARGYLSSVTTLTRRGDKVTARTRRMNVDALGELAELDDTPVVWDSAAALPSLAQVGDVSVAGFGPLTGLIPEAAGASGEWISPGARPRSVASDPWQVADGAASVGAPASGLPDGVGVPNGSALLIDGLEWMQARVYDADSRGFLSTDPLEPGLGTSWSGNPYSFAGNDPRNSSDPWGLRPVTDAELQGYRDSNNGSLRNAASAATSWVKDNWEYIAAGALIVGGIAVMCTGVGGPIGAAMIGGALMSAGASAGMQKFQNGSVDWGQVAVDGAIGGVAGLAGGGAGVAVARQAARSSMNCLGRNVLTGAAAGAAEGGTSGALSYATSGQPLSVSGFVQATGTGIAYGGAGGAAAGGILTRVSGSACFVAGTQVLLGDGSAKAIEDIVVGDEVLAADPETGQTHTKRVLDTYVTADVETYEVETTAGTVTSTAEHPFWVEGRGWTPVRELAPGDKLVDADGVRVELLAVCATGETATVHNLNVDGLHTYHVQAGDSWIRVHNTCEWSPTHAELRPELRGTGYDSHHIIQDAAVRDLPGYSRSGAPTIGLEGPSTTPGTEHYLATQAQRSIPGGGTYGAERQIGIQSLQAAGKSPAEIADAVQRADTYFKGELGVHDHTPTNYPGNRRTP